MYKFASLTWFKVKMQRNNQSHGGVRGHLNFDKILTRICGENAVPPVNKDEREVKPFLTIVFLGLVAPNEVFMRDREENLVKSIEDGRTAQMSAERVKKAAAHGFVADEDRDCVGCPACKKRVRVDRIGVSDMMDQHSAACPYPRLCSRSVTKDLYQQQHFKSVVEHLCQQWKTTKVGVALEMGFHPCLVLIALVHRHFRHERAFPNAGVLVETLMDMEDPDIQRPPVLWDVTLLVKSLESLKELSLQDPRKMTISTTTFEQLPIGPKAHARQRNYENSPQSSLEIQDPPQPAPSKPTNTKETLIEETMRLVYRWRCKNCGKVDADRLLTACGHLSLCSNCLKIRRCCPICDTSITESIRVFAV